jgi:L-malate glycosyltransferase
VRVLYVSHTAHVSGAEEALFDLLRALPPSVEPLGASPPGPLAERLRELGIPVHEIPATVGSLRLHPVHTPQALGQLARTAAHVRQLTRRLGAPVVHANSIRAGLATVAAARAGSPRPVVYLHDSLPPGRVSSLVHSVIGRGAAMVLANSHHTAARFSTDADAPSLKVVYYGVDVKRFDPSSVDRDEVRGRLGVRAGDPVLAVIGQLTPWKGQDHAIRVVAKLRQHRPNVRLLLAGSAKFVSRATRYDNQTYVRHLRELVESLGLSDNVRFLGERRDIPAVFRAVDIALVPSWEEPFGRAVTEALAMEVPVVATSEGGPAEIIQEARTGFLRPPRDVEAWVAAVDELLSHPDRRRQMGLQGQAAVAERFPMSRFVDGIVEAYSAAVPRQPSVGP